VWWGLWRAGIDPALAGALVGIVVPLAPRVRGRWERVCTRTSTSLVLPLFCVLSCGVTWSLVTTTSLSVVTGAEMIVRLAGKVVGVVGGVALARAWGATWPATLGRAHLLGAAMLCAMGVTVPLLFASALFGTHSPTTSALTLGLILATILGGAGGVFVLRRAA